MSEQAYAAAEFEGYLRRELERVLRRPVGCRFVNEGYRVETTDMTKELRRTYDSPYQAYAAALRLLKAGGQHNQGERPVRPSPELGDGPGGAKSQSLPASLARHIEVLWSVWMKRGGMVARMHAAELLQALRDGGWPEEHKFWPEVEDSPMEGIPDWLEDGEMDSDVPGLDETCGGSHEVSQAGEGGRAAALSPGSGASVFDVPASQNSNDDDMEEGIGA